MCNFLKNKIQMTHYGKEVVVRMNSMVDKLEKLASTIPYRHNRSDTDYEDTKLGDLLVQLKSCNKREVH